MISLAEKEDLMIALLNHAKPIAGNMKKNPVDAFAKVLSFAGGMKKEISEKALTLLLSIRKSRNMKLIKKYQGYVNKFVKYSDINQKAISTDKTFDVIAQNVFAVPKSIIIKFLFGNR